ncbi:MAG: PRC-barrel domain-containing protein [Candidatus Nanohaloarchaeota archaeon QJJ-9]|nr:PRC-barrel domain-containing protein [Candidatus Nanohaloarchaeota archaeon QJJ-9]
MPSQNVLDMQDLVDKDVFTSKGAYCGKARDIELNLPNFKVQAVVVEAAKGSYLANKVGGKKPVIVPYNMVNAVSDVVMIKHFSGQAVGTEEGPEEGEELEE